MLLKVVALVTQVYNVPGLSDSNPLLPGLTTIDLTGIHGPSSWP